MALAREFHRLPIKGLALSGANSQDEHKRMVFSPSFCRECQEHQRVPRVPENAKTESANILQRMPREKREER
jgi:hypothetical protein